MKQGPLHTETVPQIYTAWEQGADGMIAENVSGMMRSLRIAIRTDMDPATLASAVRQQIRAIDPALPVAALRTMAEVVETSTMVVRQGLLLAAIGLAVGLPVAWMLSRVMATLLFQVSPRDPVTFVSAGGVLAAVALLACVIPAWRATRVNPLTVLRTQ